MALQAWMKKEGLFDRDMLRELDTQFGVKDPEYDFSKMSKAQWKDFEAQMKLQKKQELKDKITFMRFEKKLAKIKMKWKTQQGKKFKDTASVIKQDIEETSNISPNKAKQQNPKNKAKNTKNNNNNNNNNKQTVPKSAAVQAVNPKHVQYAVSLWLRECGIDESAATYKQIPFFMMVLKYCVVFGHGRDGTLLVNANKTHILRSNQLYEFESIILKKKATLTVDVWKTKAPLQEHTNMDGSGGVLLLRVSGNIVMHEGSKITVRGCGYVGGHGKGCKGGKGFGAKASGGDAGEWNSSTGGLYVSKGIGNAEMDGALVLGSGGGGHTGAGNRFFPGGSGGGVLKIECGKLVFKGDACVLTASGSNSVHGGGGSGGILWLRCLGIAGKDEVIQKCKITNKGGSGDGDEYSEGKEGGEEGRIRIDVLQKTNWNKIKAIVKCKNVFYGEF